VDQLSESQLDKSPKSDNKREKTKVQNRQAILEAAREVFAEVGVGAASIREIVRRTNLASGTFYNYFTSKEDVFQALLDESALSVRPELTAERLGATTIDAFIEGCFRVFFDSLVSDQAMFAVLRRNSGTLRVRMHTPQMLVAFEELEIDLERAIGQGLLPNIDTDYLSSALIGVAFEVGDRMLCRAVPDPQEAARFATALTLSGIKALPLKKAVQKEE